LSHIALPVCKGLCLRYHTVPYSTIGLDLRALLVWEELTLLGERVCNSLTLTGGRVIRTLVLRTGTVEVY